ncbi:MAG: ABC transporter substrate-binding protein [Candidatus Thorarchaeota archaeon]
MVSLRSSSFAVIFIIIMLQVSSTSPEVRRVSPDIASLSEIGSTIVIGTTSGVESTLDIAQSFDIFGWTMISCLSSGLVEIRPNSTAAGDDIIPALAESWSVSTDATIWDFNLREGVVFEDGEPFSATHVKYTFDRNCNLTGVGLLTLDGPQFNIGYNTIIENVTLLSEFAVRFYLKIPFAPFLNLLAIPPSFIVDPTYAPIDELVTYIGGNPRGSHPCGLGPFLLESWSRVGGVDNEIRLIANPDYWDGSSGEPKSDEVIVKFYSSETALAAAMMAGEIDIAHRDLTPVQLGAFRELEDTEVYREPNAQIQYLCFNQNFYPLNETLIRQGIGAALNRSHVCEVVFQNEMIPLESIVPSNLEYHYPSFAVYGESNYSFTRAALQLFGYNESNKLNLDLYYESSGHYPQSVEQALVYESHLESTGVINVALHGLEWPSYRLARNAGTMPIFTYGYYYFYSDADNYAFLPFANWLNIGYNESYPQGGVDQYNLWLEGRSTITDSERRAAYYSLQELQAAECSVIPIWQGHDAVVAGSDVSGVYPDFSGLLRYWLLETVDATPTISTSSSSTTTTTTTNTTNNGLPFDMITLFVSLTSAGVIIIIVIVIINSRKK